MILGSIIAGLFATAIMTLVMLYVGPMMGLMPSDWNMITDGLGGMINKMMGLTKSMGWIAHFMVGSLIHPLVYDYIWTSIFGSILVNIWLSFSIYALVFAAIMIMMFPMLGIPSDYKSKMRMGVIVVHIVYALSFVYLVGIFNF